MSNYSILERNILDSLETDDACAAFLWACTLPDADRYQYRAEAFAREVDRLAQVQWQFLTIAERVVLPMLPGKSAGGRNEAVKEDLYRYIMDRHTFHTFPGRKAGWTACLDPGLLEAA